MRVPQDQLAVLERARLGLVRVDDDVARFGWREEARLAPGREACASAAAEAGGGDGLDDLLTRLRIVPRQHHGVLQDGGRDAGRGDHRLRPLAAPGRLRVGRDAHEHPVVGAVVGALELRDLRPARERAREAHGVHRPLGARVREADLLDRRHAPGQELREPHLVLRGPRERETVRDRLLDHLDDLGRRVAQDQTRVAVEVDTVGAVGVPDVGALATLDVERVRVEERGRPAVAARHDRQRLVVQGAGADRLRRVLVDLLLDAHAISSLSPVSKMASARYNSRWASSTVTARNRSDCPGLTCPTRPTSNEQTVATFV